MTLALSSTASGFLFVAMLAVGFWLFWGFLMLVLDLKEAEELRKRLGRLWVEVGKVEA